MTSSNYRIHMAYIVQYANEMSVANSSSAVARSNRGRKSILCLIHQKVASEFVVVNSCEVVAYIQRVIGVTSVI